MNQTLLALALVGLVLHGSRPFLLKLAVAGLALPVIAVWVLSQRRPVYVDRYFIVLMPFVAALVAAGASSLGAEFGRLPRALRPWAVPVSLGLAMTIGLGAAFTVHFGWKFDKEDWRSVAYQLALMGADPALIALSHVEMALPLRYYGVLESETEYPPQIPACAERCWWVLRGPYANTHAFAQSLVEPRVEGELRPPEGCAEVQRWRSSTGLSIMEIACE